MHVRARTDIFLTKNLEVYIVLCYILEIIQICCPTSAHWRGSMAFNDSHNLGTRLQFSQCASKIMLKKREYLGLEKVFRFLKQQHTVIVIMTECFERSIVCHFLLKTHLRTEKLFKVSNDLFYFIWFDYTFFTLFQSMSNLI